MPNSSRPPDNARSFNKSMPTHQLSFIRTTRQSCRIPSLRSIFFQRCRISACSLYWFIRLQNDRRQELRTEEEVICKRLGRDKCIQMSVLRQKQTRRRSLNTHRLIVFLCQDIIQNSLIIDVAAHEIL